METTTFMADAERLSNNLQQLVEFGTFTQDEADEMYTDILTMRQFSEHVKIKCAARKVAMMKVSDLIDIAQPVLGADWYIDMVEKCVQLSLLKQMKLSSASKTSARVG